MKKTYVNPTMKVVKIQTRQMLADSTTLGINSGIASEWGSREFDFDDDEEE